MKKILNVISNLALSDGVTNFVLNYYQHIDGNKFNIDFLCVYPTKYPKNDLGDDCTVFEISLDKKNPKLFYLQVCQLLEDNNYDCVHVHILGPAAYLCLKAAKINGIKKIIWHSHNTRNGDTKLNAFRNTILARLSMHYPNILLSCSDEASHTLFWNKKSKVIKNAIDYEKFMFDSQKRESIRRKCSLEGYFVVGTVARMANQKNPFFILDIIKELSKVIDKLKFIWIGDGPLKEDVVKYIEANNLTHIVELMGSKPNVNELYNVMDVFLLPSLFEGLGIVFIEAQTNGLLTIASDNVPKTTNITSYIKYVSLEHNAKSWAEFILGNKEYSRGIINEQDIIKAGFSIKHEVKKLEDIYEY